MANVIQRPYGVTIELDHGETQNLLGAGLAGGASGAVAAILTAAGAAAAIPVVGAAIAGYIGLESALIKAMDHGDGIILTAMYFPPGLVIPATRYAGSNPPDWSTKDSGELISPGNDHVVYTIQRNGAGNDTMAVFKLTVKVPSGWAKALVLPDGHGNNQVISCNGNASTEGYIMARDLGDQSITFRKPGFLGIWIDAFSTTGGLHGIKGNDLVHFTWTMD